MRASTSRTASVITLTLATAVSGCGSDGGDAGGAGAGDRERVGSTSSAVTPKCGASMNGPVQGRDVSFYQGAFDWAGAKAQSGVVFGHARISDGTTYIDPTFGANWASMKSAGVLRGAYQYFEPAEDADAQAQLVIDRIGRLGDGDLPAVIDVETTGGQAPAVIASKVRRWLQLVEAGTGKRPWIYTGAYFWEDQVRDATFGQYPLWIASYGITCPGIPNGWTSWTSWQYSDGNGLLDHNVFNGSLSQLESFARGANAADFPPIVRRSATDVNGDGMADVCGRSSAGVECAVATADGAFVRITDASWSDAAWKDPGHGSTVQFGDVNGDGKADVCGRAAAGFVCRLSDGAAFTTTTKPIPWSDAEGWNEPEYYATIQLVDVNGDGKQDACARGWRGIECYLSDGAGFPTKIVGPDLGNPQGWDRPDRYTSIQFADLNGDGKDDVCGRDAGGVVCHLSDGAGFPTKVTGPAWSDERGWSAPSTGSTLRLVDLDGDGKADLCARASDGVRCVLGTGQGFGPEILGPTWSDATGWGRPEHYGTVVFADLDGDGLRDVCARAVAGVECSRFDGKAFGERFRGPVWSNAEGWNKLGYFTSIGAVDVNHDGKDDLCGRNATGIVCAVSTGSGFAAPTMGPAWTDAAGWGGPGTLSPVRYLGATRRGSAGGPGGASGGSGAPGSKSTDGAAAGGGDEAAAGDGCTMGVGHTRSASVLDGLAGLVLAAAAFVRRRSRAVGPRSTFG